MSIARNIKIGDNIVLRDGTTIVKVNNIIDVDPTTIRIEWIWNDRVQYMIYNHDEPIMLQSELLTIMGAS